MTTKSVSANKPKRLSNLSGFSASTSHDKYYSIQNPADMAHSCTKEALCWIFALTNPESMFYKDRDKTGNNETACGQG